MRKIEHQNLIVPDGVFPESDGQILVVPGIFISNFGMLVRHVKPRCPVVYISKIELALSQICNRRFFDLTKS
jgi:hypothetical protein